MPAKSKVDLIAVTEKEFSRLEKILKETDESVALTPHPDDGITIKDTVAHRAHWIDLFFGWVDDGAAGRPVHVPAKGVKWNQLKAYNAHVRQRMAGMSWAEVTARLQAGHDRLTDFLAEQTEADLYGAHPHGWQGTWPLGRWAEAAGASHYRSAAKYIREIRRALDKPVPR